MSFKDKSIFITGGSTGIGLQVGLDFVKEGGSVVITGRNEDKLKAAVEEISKVNKDRIAYIVADSKVEKDIENAVKFTVEKFGKLDIAFNNSGVAGGAKIHETSEEDFDNLFDINVKGVFLSLKHETKYFVENNVKGIIINTSSAVTGTVNKFFAGFATYTATKSAVDSLTRGAAAQYGSLGIRVNAINPGFTVTGILGSSEAIEGFGKENSILERAAQPKEISDSVLFLASEKASYITGQCLHVEGGTQIV